MKFRLDAELFRRKLVRSRESGSQLIVDGYVAVNGIIIKKPASQVDQNSSIVILERENSYVSRGGEKLAGALQAFKITDLTGRRALDAGASTGGFTDVLLRLGVSDVVAVDVGYGQLDWSLQNNPQVKILDRQNIRTLTSETVGYKVDLIVADLSFISLTVVLSALINLAQDDADFFLMVKPQFEVGKENLGKGGVVKDQNLRKLAIEKVADSAYQEGLGVIAVVASPLPGPSGNVEYFLWLNKRGDRLSQLDLMKALEEGPI
jgi:23S rRNA (cytidine1920-2'-O)/16S rRNA (cytidine1409-2'-O)-methyltransferase